MEEIIRIGTIRAIDNTFPILRVQVEMPGSEEIETAVLYNAWGENSFPSAGSPCLVVILNGEFAQKYALPFNLNDAVSILAGEKIIFTSTGTRIYLKQNGSINIDALNDSTKPSINISATTAVNIITPSVNASGDINVDGVYKVDDVQVIGLQQPTIANPTGGTIVDIEARTAIISILTAMKTHGIIAT
jgi:phage gp45-like